MAASASCSSHSLKKDSEEGQVLLENEDKTVVDMSGTQAEQGTETDDQPKGNRFKVAKVLFADENPTSSATDDKTSASEDTFSSTPPMSPSHTIRSFGYNTENLKTFGKNTHEALPHVDHYRNLMSAAANMDLKTRPTLSQLHDVKPKEVQLPRNASNLQQYVDQNGDIEQTPQEEEPIKVVAKKAIKFGWIQGVLIRCLLNIWGVMLFLRLSWVVGAAGIGLTSVIILLASVVTVITSLSMSAICTNGEVRGGGAYYMISRSLGPEFGGAIGMIFSVANAIAVAMYVVGFAETIRDILVDFDALIVDETNDVRIIGIITVIALLCIALIGMEWEARAQVVLLGLLIIAMINLVVGTFIPPTSEKRSKGFYGYRGEIFVANFGPDFREGEDFFSVFALFFPAATGILAGANISGDLEDAQSAIPKGTLLAILISTIVYLFMAWLVGSCAVRDATGHLVADLVINVTCPAAGCKHGLLNSMQVMQLMSGWGPLITVGIVSATLSSALASLVSAPKVFQAVCKDRIFPGIHIFAKGYGIADEPRRGYLLAFFLAICFICIGDLNAIAPLISNFFLMAYLLINYACFDASLSKSPGWRPAFRFYSMWLSLFGAIICLAVMFVINWWAALTTLIVVTALYMYVRQKKPDVNWGSSTQANVYKDALQSALKLTMVDEHVKNFRPQVLVLTGTPSSRPALVDFVSGITKNISLMVCGQVIIEPCAEKHLRHFPRTHQISSWFNKRKIKSFYSYVVAPNFLHGAECLLQTVGVGKLKPNTLMMGFKNNWREDKPEKMEEYLHIIHAGFDAHFGVGILRVESGFDTSSVLGESPAVQEDNSSPEVSPAKECSEERDPLRRRSSTAMDNMGASGDFIAMSTSSVNQEDVDTQDEEDDEYQDQGNERGKASEGLIPMDNLLLKSINQFQRKQKKGHIDVWWLFDDGGLTLLIPYILAQKSQWRNCELRVFTAGTKKQALDRDHKNMATLLSKFRINYSQMQVIPNIGKMPLKETREEFKGLIEPLKLKEGESHSELPWKITEEELDANKVKTYRHLRLRELLLEKSNDANLIFMTLPVPRKGTCSAGLYMSWLDTLTRGMPPIMLLRGNQESVLTYYS